MRDVSVDEFAEELREELRQKGVELPRGVVQVMTRQFFSFAEELIESKKEDVRFSMYNRDLTHVFNVMNIKALCEEFASGKGVSYQTLLKKKKLSGRARHHLRMKMKDTME
jgi:hypothetical protein